MKSVFGGAKVTAEGAQTYPITVTVTRVQDGKEVWTGSQRKLFRKYAEWREESVNAIKKELSKLK